MNSLPQIYVIAFGMLVTCFGTTAAGAELDDMAKTVADQITEKPTGIERVYHPSFLSQISAARVESLLSGFHKQYGPVVSVTSVEQDSDVQGKFTFAYEKGTLMTVSLTITRTTPPQVVGLWFGPPTEALKDFDAALSELRKLPGTVGMQLARLGDEIEVLHQLRGDEELPIGSTFKLYILATLVDEKADWAGVVKLDPEAKSLPSGSFHAWPDHSPMTVHTLAAAMISRSDNTATDQLIAHLGRKRIEQQLAPCGHAQPEQTMPFLTTMEMFKIKSDEKLADQYAKADINARRTWLSGRIKRIDREDVNPYPEGKPMNLDTVEWFASPADLVRLMDWFRRRDDRTAMDIMAINRGLDVSEKAFPYAGYKGGSEPGVISMTWLLKRSDGQAFALTATWMNAADEGVDLTRFSGIMQGMINLLAAG